MTKTQAQILLRSIKEHLLQLDVLWGEQAQRLAARLGDDDDVYVSAYSCVVTLDNIAIAIEHVCYYIVAVARGETEPMVAYRNTVDTLKTYNLLSLTVQNIIAYYSTCFNVRLEV
ncbi:MAG: hypothetical protein KatS3mg087_1777 [Patescibacteria group bacterium]|nr:MAG: hypothetical protein KatS3mg087_1777 [Patescibacteria group bacterium]